MGRATAADLATMIEQAIHDLRVSLEGTYAGRRVVGVASRGACLPVVACSDGAVFLLPQSGSRWIELPPVPGTPAWKLQQDAGAALDTVPQRS